MKMQIFYSLFLVLLIALVGQTRGDTDYAEELLAPFLEPSTTATTSSSSGTLSFGKPSFGSSSIQATTIFGASDSGSASASAGPNAGLSPQRPPPPSARARAKVRAALQIARETQCNPNVCFALSASKRLSATDFQQQKEFVKLVSAIISLDSSATFAATQYARRARRISALTENADGFLRRVDLARRRCPCEGRPRVGAGVSMCRRMMKNVGGVRKVVVLGDGRGGVGGRAAERFLAGEGTGVCGVQVGGSPGAMERAAGQGVDVVSISGWFDLVDIIDDLVRAVCGAPPNF